MGAASPEWGMPDPEGIPVTADRPDAPIHTTGIDHITLIGSNEADTVAFYRDLLGMSLVLRQPNLDDPSSTHLFFDTGDGRILTFFVADRESDPQPVGGEVGSVHHLSVRVDPERFDAVREALAEAGRQFNDFDRGIFRSLYTRDHNGMLIELATDAYAIPDDRRAEVLAKTQEIRERDGADHAEDRHLEAALESLDIPVDPAGLGDAPSGVGDTQ